MNPAPRILARLRAEGRRVTLEDGKVIIEPSVGLTPAAIAELRLHKAELVRFLEDLAGVHRDEPTLLSRFTPDQLDHAASPAGLPLGDGAVLHVGDTDNPPWLAPDDEHMVDLPGMVEAITAWHDPMPARVEPKVKAEEPEPVVGLFGDMRRQSA